MLKMWKGGSRRALMASLSVALCAPVYANDTSVDVHCFSSPDDATALELRLYLESEVWVGGLVLHRGADDFIPLSFEHEEMIEDVPGGPDKYRATWLEVVDGEVTGKYEVFTQRAEVYDFAYLNRTTGERVDLSVQTPPREKWLDLNGVCDWWAEEGEP